MSCHSDLNAYAHRAPADDVHEFTANRICATASWSATRPSNSEISRNLTPESDIDDLSDVLAALAMMVPEGMGTKISKAVSCCG